MHLTAPFNEQQRLQVLRAYDILDSAPEEMFDEITSLTATICEAPIALVSLLDESRQWFKSRIGVLQQELPREASTFCGHLLDGAELLMVPDALADDRFALHPLVQGQPHIRFYAGAPLLSPEGAVLGTLCVLDYVPRQLSDLQVRTLQVHSREIMRQIQMRRDVRELRESQQAEQRSAAENQQTLAALRKQEAAQRMLAARLEVAQKAGGLGSWVVHLPSYEAEWSEEIHHLFGTNPTTHGSYDTFMERVHPDDVEIVDEVFKESIERGTHGSFVHRMVMSDGLVKHIEQRWQTLLDDFGRPYQVVGTSQDVTTRILTEFRLKRLNRLYAVASGINAAIVRINDTQKLYEEACRIAVEQGGLRMAWVGTACQESQTLQPVAVCGDDTGYLKAIQISVLPEPRGLGPAGRAYRENQVVYCHDIANDPAMALWHEAAQKGGYHSLASFPLCVAGRPVGAFTVYGDAPGYFDGDSFQFLGAITENLSYAVESHLREQQRRQTEVALKASEARFRSYFELSMHGIAVFTPEKGWLQANDRLLSILGYSREELMSTSWTDITHSEDLSVCEGLYGSLLDGSIEKFEVEKRFIRKDGGVIWTSVGVGCVKNPDGTIAYIIAVVLDIDARKQSEQILREQATLLDKAQDAIMVRDLQDHILYWNKSAERLYGWTAAETKGRSGADLLYRDDLTHYQAAREATLTKGEWMGELQHWSKDGRPITVEARWTLIHDDFGQPRSILTINTDISARKQIEQQFLRTQRMESIGTLAGGIAHDLNNVLAPIMMSIDLLRLREKDPRRLEILQTIEGSTRRGADMVRQVLSFARGVVGEKVDVQLGHLVAEIVHIVRETFLQHIQIQARTSDGLWVVQGDPTQIHQVLLNLCVNARDAMPCGGTITISACNVMVDAQYAATHIGATPGPHVRLSVEDTGTGMPPEVLDRIFEPFFTTKEVGKGTGLGLSTSVSIVKQHGGFVSVRSDVGQGTTFSIYLPAQTEGAAPAEEAPPPVLPHGSGELILVVDDEASVSDITRQTLESYGYRVLLASNGVDALALYNTRQAEIAVVLTDLMMPIMDGPTTIQVLRRLNPDVRIIAASGLNSDNLVSKATNAGASQILPKPYSAETLLQALRTALDGKLD